MMKFFTGWLLAAGLALATTAAQAQVPAPYEAGRSPYRSVSDIGNPYYAPPPQYPGPRQGHGLRGIVESHLVVLQDAGWQQSLHFAILAN